MLDVKGVAQTDTVRRSEPFAEIGDDFVILIKEDIQFNLYLLHLLYKQRILIIIN